MLKIVAQFRLDFARLQALLGEVAGVSVDDETARAIAQVIDKHDPGAGN